jgi:hypothetical protein
MLQKNNALVDMRRDPWRKRIQPLARDPFETKDVAIFRHNLVFLGNITLRTYQLQVISIHITY